MSENMKENKKVTFYKVINAILIFSIIIGLALSWFASSNFKDSNEVSLNNMASLIRFLIGDKNQMFFNIALHNLSIAIFSFILSFLTHGLLGWIFLFFNSFVLGAVLSRVHTFYTVIFVFLELLGICISVFGGAYLAKKRNRDDFSLHMVLKHSILLIVIMAIIYFCAAFIEGSLIITKWR